LTTNRQKPASIPLSQAEHARELITGSVHFSTTTSRVSTQNSDALQHQLFACSCECQSARVAATASARPRFRSGVFHPTIYHCFPFSNSTDANTALWAVASSNKSSWMKMRVQSDYKMLSSLL
jgi:hypothetical protein